MRMGRVLGLVAAALVLCMAALALVVYLSRDENNLAIDNLLSEKFSRAVALSADGDRVDLRRLAPFARGHVLIVASGTPRAAISDRIGYRWNGVARFRTGDLMLFERGGPV